MRRLAGPFVVAPPGGARIRTRLRPSAWDAAVVRAVAAQLGRLAGQDLALRCQIGPAPDQRTIRKQAMTAACSSRWAGAITRTCNDQWERGFKNLLDARVGLRRAARKLRARLAVPAGQRQGRTRGFTVRRSGLRSSAASGRGGEAGPGRGAHLDWSGVGVPWRPAARQAPPQPRPGRHRADRGQVAGLLGGGAAVPHRRRGGRQALGQRDHPRPPRRGLAGDPPADPLAHLSNTPGRAPTYRLSCPVAFTHRRGEWAAQAASGAVRYDISLDPLKGGGTGTGRWHLDASWRLPARPVPSLDNLRQHRSLGVDLNADHLAAWILKLDPPMPEFLAGWSACGAGLKRIAGVLQGWERPREGRAATIARMQAAGSHLRARAR